MKLLVINFEGLDGAGKTFAMEHLAEYYTKNHQPVIIVKSIPYETFLKSHDPEWFDLTHPIIRYAEYLTWQINNYYRNIKPNIGKSIVLVDRFLPSCYAYNTFDKDEYEDTILHIMDHLCSKFFKPDITFWVDVPDEVLEERHKKTMQPDKMTNFDFIRAVRKRYKEFFSKFPKWNLKKIKGDQDINLIIEEMVKTIDNFNLGGQ